MAASNPIKIILNSLTELYEQQNHKSIIIDFSSIPEQNEFIATKITNAGIVSIEETYLQQNKDRLTDFSDLNQRILELFLNNLSLKEYIVGMICQPEQYKFQSNVSADKTQNELQFLQYQQSQIKRSARIYEKDIFNLKSIVDDLKQSGVPNRQGVQMLSFKINIDLQQIDEYAFSQAAQFAKLAQSLKQAPTIEIKLFSRKCQALEMCRLATKAFTLFNYHLVQYEVEPEHLLLITNLPDLYIRSRGPMMMNLDSYRLTQIGEEIGFRVVQVLCRSLPSALNSIFFSFDRNYLLTKYIFHFFNNLPKQQCFSCWPYGVVLNAQFFDEVFQSYSIVQRTQSALITMNQTLKVMQNSLASKYKDEQEKEEIKSIQLG